MQQKWYLRLRWLLLKMAASDLLSLQPDAWAFFFECLGIQFFNSLTCDLRDIMPRQRSLTLLPREAEDFPRGDRHFKHVPPHTYLIYLSPKELYVLGLFKHYGYLTMKHNVSYEIWKLFTIGYKLDALSICPRSFMINGKIRSLCFCVVEAFILP